MGSLSRSHVWIMRAWFLVLALLILFFHLLPLDTLPRSWAPPDLLIAFAFAWALRRPDFVPVLSIAAVMLMSDLLLQRPPGLLAVLVVLGSEVLKSRAATPGETGFAAEWISVCLVLIAVTLTYRLILTLLVVQQAPITLSLIQMVLTMAIYPLIVVITQSVMGVRRPSRAEADALGGRG